ncbi:predicted protein [Coccidioides posadasii C735 delta SOWgp]|uniref:Uncharacterized protein n=1 Tax=Coccidioides posadasii (strain C735) TaxID=222929 RepID=C5P357_COCP7|nr:predicted protein [Coccidioides posadasii C735 delta SOWgp]EER28745.1 predicted protein [Coccidioides posadasii C735 delta SOWgp]|eukprot:XP_003070890.1 predicted protein [Coccidioides posadasii C735 delta SOWgp]
MSSDAWLAYVCNSSIDIHSDNPKGKHRNSVLAEAESAMIEGIITGPEGPADVMDGRTATSEPNTKPEKNAGEYSGTPSLRQNSANAIPSIKARRKASQGRARLTNLAPDYRVAEPSTGQGWVRARETTEQIVLAAWQLSHAGSGKSPLRRRRKDGRTDAANSCTGHGWMDGWGSTEGLCLEPVFRPVLSCRCRSSKQHF